MIFLLFQFPFLPTPQNHSQALFPSHTHLPSAWPRNVHWSAFCLKKYNTVVALTEAGGEKSYKKNPKKVLGEAVQAEMSNMSRALCRGEWGCSGSVTSCQVHVIKSPLERDRAAFRAGWWVSPALLCQLKGVIKLFPWSVKETPACPTADISLALSSAGDVQGYFWRSTHGTFHCSSSWNDPEGPQTAVVLAVLSFSSMPCSLFPPFLWSLWWDWLMHPARNGNVIVTKFSTLQIPLTLTPDYKALFKAQPLWKSNISAMTCNKMTSSCSGKGCNKVCWWVVSGIWPS